MQAQTRADGTDDVERMPGTQLPDGLQSPRAKLVYLYLATHGAVTEEELCEGLGMKRISLYSILGALRDKGHVARESGRYVPA